MTEQKLARQIHGQVSDRIANALARASTEGDDFTRINKLINTSDEQLQSLRCIGKKSVAEIRAAVGRAQEPDLADPEVQKRLADMY